MLIQYIKLEEGLHVGELKKDIKRERIFNFVYFVDKTLSTKSCGSFRKAIL